MENSLTYAAEKLQADNSANYDLLLRISETEWSYLIIDPVSSELLAAYHDGSEDDMGDKIQRSVSRNSVLKNSFRQVKASVEGKNFTFIPDSLYNGNPSEYALFTGSGQGTMGSDIISSAGLVNVYLQNTRLAQLLADRFGSFSYFHQAGSFIEAVLKANSHTEALYLNLNNTSFELVYLKDGSLNLYNIFDLYGASDIIYYLSNLVHTLGINSGVPVVLSGHSDQDSESYKLLASTFGSLDFASTPALLQYDENAVANGHRFFALAGLSLCGS